MSLTDIHERFIRRETTPEDEASLMAQTSQGHWLTLLWRRDQFDLRRQWETLQSMMPAVVADLRRPLGPGDGIPEIGRRMLIGLALLIEEIHHLNETAEARRKDRS